MFAERAHTIHKYVWDFEISFSAVNWLSPSNFLSVYPILEHLSKIVMPPDILIVYPMSSYDFWGEWWLPWRCALPAISQFIFASCQIFYPRVTCFFTFYNLRISRYTLPSSRSFTIRSTSAICAMLISSFCPSDRAINFRKSVTRICRFYQHAKKKNLTKQEL